MKINFSLNQSVGDCFGNSEEIQQKSCAGNKKKMLGSIFHLFFESTCLNCFCPFDRFPSLIELEESKLFLRKNLSAQQSTIERRVVKVFFEQSALIVIKCCESFFLS